MLCFLAEKELFDGVTRPFYTDLPDNHADVYQGEEKMPLAWRQKR